MGTQLLHRHGNGMVLLTTYAGSFSAMEEAALPQQIGYAYSNDCVMSPLQWVRK